jgi:hypothetical protein
MRSFLQLLPFLALIGAAPAPQATPALWKVADADTTIYLFGTVHVLPARLQWRDAAIDRALRQADSLTIETVLDEQPNRVANILGSLGRGAGLPPLDQRVPAAKRPALLALVKASGLPLQAFQPFKTWAAAVMLTGTAIRQMDLGTDALGVEPQLEAQFRAAGKPIEGLETPEAQLGYFDRLPEASQRRFLVSTLDSPAAQKKDFAETVAAWRTGNVAKLEAAFRDDPEFTPALRDLLIRQRDRAWADTLAIRMKKPGTVFVAVGAGHLVGPDSVQRMLAAKGIVATRVR